MNIRAWLEEYILQTHNTNFFGRFNRGGLNPLTPRLWVRQWITVSDNDTSGFTGTTERRENNFWKDESSDDCKELAGTAATWRGVAVRSRHEQRRPDNRDSRQPCTTVMQLAGSVRRYGFPAVSWVVTLWVVVDSAAVGDGRWEKSSGKFGNGAYM